MSLIISETYQKGINTQIKKNYEISQTVKDIEELNSRLINFNKDLLQMNIADVERHQDEVKIKFFKPNKVGLFKRTIKIIKYNRPRRDDEDFNFI